MARKAWHRVTNSAVLQHLSALTLPVSEDLEPNNCRQLFAVLQLAAERVTHGCRHDAVLAAKLVAVLLAQAAFLQALQRLVALSQAAAPAPSTTAPAGDSGALLQTLATLLAPLPDGVEVGAEARESGGAAGSSASAEEQAQEVAAECARLREELAAAVAEMSATGAALARQVCLPPARDVTRPCASMTLGESGLLVWL